MTPVRAWMVTGRFQGRTFVVVIARGETAAEVHDIAQRAEPGFYVLTVERLRSVEVKAERVASEALEEARQGVSRS